MDILFGTEPSCTGRGYFTDAYGQKCLIQPSSAAGEGAIHFGVQDGGKHFPDIKHATMHLTQSMVRSLLPYLQAFADTGELQPDPQVLKEAREANKLAALRRALDGAAGELDEDGHEDLGDALRHLIYPEG